MEKNLIKLIVSVLTLSVIMFLVSTMVLSQILDQAMGPAKEIPETAHTWLVICVVSFGLMASTLVIALFKFQSFLDVMAGLELAPPKTRSDREIIRRLVGDYISQEDVDAMRVETSGRDFRRGGR